MRILVTVCISANLAIAQAPSVAGDTGADAAVPHYVDPVGQLYGAVARLSKQQINALRKDAESSDPESELKYGMVCETRPQLLGISLNSGRLQATDWYAKAANQGNPFAERLLASSNIGNHAFALEWYRRAASQGDIESAYSVGQMYLDGDVSGKPDPSEAVSWFLIAAKGGDIQAAFKVGSFYECGCGTSKNDAEAAKWYRIAASRGWNAAQLALGNLYESGRGVAKDIQEAARWFGKAADRNGNAAYKYGLLIEQYPTLLGKSANEARAPFRRAALLFKRDAASGDASACLKLGQMYESGMGVGRNFEEAYFWYSVGDVDDPSVRNDIERVRKHLSAKQVANIERRITKWNNDN